MEIKGMTCEGCAQSITQSLKRSKGVKEVKVDWRGGLAEVAFDSAETGPEEILANRVFDLAFSVQLKRADCCA